MSERGSRVRRLVGRTSGKQRLGAAAAVALLVTAPFGGLDRSAPTIEHVRADHAIKVGPFTLTVDKVVSVGDLEPSASPVKEGDRLIVVAAHLTNSTRRPEYATTLLDALSLHDAGVVDAAHGGLRPSLLSYDDGQDISHVNPGLTYQVAIVYEQDGGWSRTPVRLDIDELEFEHTSELTLDEDYWLDLDRTAASGTFDVEVKR